MKPLLLILFAALFPALSGASTITSSATCSATTGATVTGTNSCQLGGGSVYAGVTVDVTGNEISANGVGMAFAEGATPTLAAPETDSVDYIVSASSQITLTVMTQGSGTGYLAVTGSVLYGNSGTSGGGGGGILIDGTAGWMCSGPNGSCGGPTPLFIPIQLGIPLSVVVTGQVQTSSDYYDNPGTASFTFNEQIQFFSSDQQTPVSVFEIVPEPPSKDLLMLGLTCGLAALTLRGRLISVRRRER